MKILKKLGWILLFIYLIIAFFPKENLFYLAEDKLKNYNIVLNHERLKDRLILFKIEQSSVYYDGLHVGDVRTLDTFIGLFYNQISLKNANFSENLRQFVPNKIDNLTIKSTILYPIKLWINGNGDFGEISGFFDLYKKKLKLILKPNKNVLTKYSSIVKEFKKINNEYVYEKNFK